MYCRIWYVDLLLHFSGDIGSPTVLSSITCSSIRVKSGSPSSIGFRPPPDFRTLPSSAARFPLPRSSPIPFRMVGLERPLSSTIRWIPPRPSRSASRPTSQRRCASLRVPRTFRNKPLSCLSLAVLIRPESHKPFHLVNVILRQPLSCLINVAKLPVPVGVGFPLFVLPV